MSTDFDLETLDERPVPDKPRMSDEDLIKAAFPKSPSWPLALAGLWAALAAAIVFTYTANGGIAFGPWQGAYLDLDFPCRAPLLSTWVARAFVAFPFMDRASCTVAASLCAGALACGVLAVVAAQGLRGKLSPPATALCGATAGITLALTPIWTRLSTSASPAPLTVLLALAGIGFLQHAIYFTAPRWLLYAGALLGLAAANDPSFVIVFIIALLATLGELGERVRVAKIFAHLLAGFCIAASVPLLHSFLAAESLAEFFSHAMNTAFPAIGDGAPQFAFGLELRPQFSWAVLAATAIGTTALFMRGMRGTSVMWGMVFLAMGPFWPSLTNQHASPYVLRDTEAASCMAYAAVCVAAGWGIAWIARTVANAPRRATWAAGVMALGLAVLAGFQFRVLPARSAVSAEKLANGIFDSCGENAVLVAGDARTVSLLRTLQIARDVRTDVTIIPVYALEQVKQRERLHRKYAGTLAVPGDFPPVEAWKRWPLERPNEFARINLQMKLGGVRESDFLDLMLWELMRDNFNDRPICFAGVSSSWLTARGKRNGVVLRYPREGSREPQSIDAIVPAVRDPGHSNPELDRTVIGLLLPLAEASRRQDDVAESARIAALSRSYAANEADVWLSSARAAARAGNGQEAEGFAANYITLARSERDIQVFLDLIKEDLRRNTIATEFRAAEQTQDASGAARDRRAKLASQLWNLDELTVLSNAYSKALQHRPQNVELLYEGAAAEVQLGELRQARDRLSEAAKIDPLRIWSGLQTDGRFLLLEAGAVPTQGILPSTRS